MSQTMSGISLEGWRMRRRPRARRDRALRIVVAGDGPMARACARRLAAGRIAEVILSCDVPSAARDAARDLGAEVRCTTLMEAAAPADALIVFWAQAERVRDVALWAARTCPLTALILAAPGGLALSREAARASGLAPYLILSPGGMPRSSAEASRLARALGVSAAQVSVPVIGGEGPAGLLPLRRYASVAGVPARDLDEAAAARWAEEPAPRITEASLAASAAALASAVVEDRLEVLCCGAWLEGSLGIPGGFVIAPVRVGARGAQEPLPLRLTAQERSLLQRAAVEW